MLMEYNAHEYNTHEYNTHEYNARCFRTLPSPSANSSTDQMTYYTVKSWIKAEIAYKPVADRSRKSSGLRAYKPVAHTSRASM